MRQQVLLSIKGFPTKVEITYSSKNSRTYHYCFGLINAKITEKYPLKKLEQDLNRVFKEEVISRFVRDDFIDGSYAYILGEIEMVYPKQKDNNDLDNIRILRKGKKVSAKNFLKDIITERVRYYERIMNLSSHEIKIKKLTAVLGNNHVKTKVLNFNEKLIHFDIGLIDSVIIHELCHDYYQDHSKFFYQKMAEYCPDYKIKREKLMLGVRK